MKRSKINSLLRDAEAFFREHEFHLPPFAYWTPQEWQTKGPEVQEIVERKLGWDITDFGKGEYKKYGLLLFTLRNGVPENLKKGRGKLYAEKIMVVDVGQITPLHFHWIKMEDIINRGGGKLIVQLYNSTSEGDLDDGNVTVSVDGVERTLEAGGKVALGPGESVSLPPGCYHQFWGESERVLVGEVSLVNDDDRDNRFYESVGRFPQIDEDEEAVYLLCNDYSRYYRV